MTRVTGEEREKLQETEMETTKEADKTTTTETGTAHTETNLKERHEPEAESTGAEQKSTT